MPTDLLSARASLAEMRVELETSRGRRDAARELLAFLTDLPATNLVLSDTSPFPSDPDIASRLDRAALRSDVLAGEALAIVSSEAGTTRDAIRSHLELAGLRLEFVGTAGVRDGAEAVEKLGIARAHQAVAQADLVLVLQAFDQPAHVLSATVPPGTPVLEVWNKSDLASAEQQAQVAARCMPARR